jgi:hypothetical protein
MAKNMERGKGRLYFPNPKLDYSTEAWENKTFKGDFGNVDSDGSEIIDEELTFPGFYNEYDLNLNKYNEDFSLVEAKIKSVSYATWDADNNKTVIHTVVNDEEHCFKHEMQEKNVSVSTSNEKSNITIPDKNAMFCLK